MDVQLDTALMEIDIKVDEMKSRLETVMDDVISDMKRAVESALLRLPARIRGMSMHEFMHEFGGDVAQVIDRDRKLNRIARTVAKGGATLTSRPIGTVLAGKTMSRIARPMPAAAAEDADSNAGLAVPGPAKVAKMAMPATTPMAAGPRSRIGDGNVPAMPSMATMKSAVPPTPSFNPALPKTPAARRARRGEVAYAVSENGSPLGAINIAVKSTNGAVGTAAEVELVLDDGLVVGDEQAVIKAVESKGADAVLSAIEAMQARLEALKSAAAATAGVAPAAAAVAAPRTVRKLR